MAILTKVWQLGQGNLEELERKAPDYFSNLNICDRKMFFTSFWRLGASAFASKNNFRKCLISS